MNTLRRILALAIKELLAILKDRRSRIVLIGPPIAQLIVFGYAATYDLNHIPLAVYNEDPGAPSRELVARLTGSPHFDLVAQLDHGAVRRELAIHPGPDNRTLDISTITKDCTVLVPAEVGHILNVLRELDLERDTIVVFTADHGDMMGSHRVQPGGRLV